MVSTLSWHEMCETASVAVQRFEDLHAAILAGEFKREVYRLLRETPARGDFAYAAQMRSAASSVEANIAEGFYRFGKKEFARFLLIARGSLGESEVRLRDGVDRGHFTVEQLAEVDHLMRRTGIAIMRLRRSVLDQVP